jgi:hypothetical protein
MMTVTQAKRVIDRTMRRLVTSAVDELQLVDVRILDIDALEVRVARRSASDEAWRVVRFNPPDELLRASEAALEGIVTMAARELATSFEVGEVELVHPAKWP